MAFSKVVVEDKIEVLELGQIQVRTKTTVLEGAVLELLTIKIIADIPRAIIRIAAYFQRIKYFFFLFLMVLDLKFFQSSSFCMGDCLDITHAFFNAINSVLFTSEDSIQLNTVAISTSVASLLRYLYINLYSV